MQFLDLSKPPELMSQDEKDLANVKRAQGIVPALARQVQRVAIDSLLQRTENDPTSDAIGLFEVTRSDVVPFKKSAPTPTPHPWNPRPVQQPLPAAANYPQELRKLRLNSPKGFRKHLDRMATLRKAGLNPDPMTVLRAFAG